MTFTVADASGVALAGDIVCAGKPYALKVAFTDGRNYHWLLISSVANTLPNADGWWGPRASGSGAARRAAARPQTPAASCRRRASRQPNHALLQRRGSLCRETPSPADCAPPPSPLPTRQHGPEDVRAHRVVCPLLQRGLQRARLGRG